MLKLYGIYLVVLLLQITPVRALSDAGDKSFAKLLDEAGLLFQSPQQYGQIPVTDNLLFPYEYALQNKALKLEIRYSIRPLGRMGIDYQDPHSSAPEPNHIYSMMFNSLIGQLSRGGSSPTREYSQQDAQQKFNADWAAISLFDIEDSYSSDYQLAFLVAIHKNNLADAYMIVLFDDYTRVKPYIDSALKSLRFK